MTNLQRLNLVRQKLADWVQAAGSCEASEVRETYLVCDGFYCGRRFQVGPFTAVWFAEENQLKIYAEQDGLVAALELDQETLPSTNENVAEVRRAA